MAECRAFEEDFFSGDDVAARSYSPTHRRTTRQHRLLLEHYDRPSEDWSSRALHACLDTLATNTWSEAWCVGVIDAWVEDDAAFCVVYRYRDYPHTLGTRRRINDHKDPYGPGADDPEQFGRNVATSDIGEPLGTVTRALQPDAAGVHWWGTLGDFLPSPPDGHHGTVAPADPPTRTRRVHDLSNAPIEEAILDEIRSVNDWVSIAAEESTERHGNFAQSDWDMRFLSALTRHLSARPWDTGVYEIERLDWADSIMTLVVRVWGRDRSGLVGWREHLPTVRSGFTPDDPERVAGAWHAGEFYPCYLPDPYVPDEYGIHWIGRGRPSHPDNLR